MTALPPRTAVVMVNFRSSELVTGALESLAGSGILTVVVDNRSDEAERAAIRLVTARADVLLVEAENDGFGTGMDRGVAAAIDAGADAVVLLNPDTRFGAAEVGELASAARHDGRALVAPTVLAGSGAVWSAGGTLDLDTGATRTLRRRGEREPDWVSGACVAITTAFWQELGGFGGEYFMYWEDIDLSARVREAGGRLVVLETTITHVAGGTQAHTGKSPLYVYYNCRNRLLFAARHLDPQRQRVWHRTRWDYARRVVLRSGRRHLLRHAPSLIWAAMRGTRDGVRFLAT